MSAEKYTRKLGMQFLCLPSGFWGKEVWSWGKDSLANNCFT